MSNVESKYPSQNAQRPLDIVLDEMNFADRAMSLHQLLNLLLLNDTFTEFERKAYHHAGAVIPPRVPMLLPQLTRLGAQIGSAKVLTELDHGFAEFKETGIEVGVGWDFQYDGEFRTSFTGVRIISLPGHIIVAGKVPVHFDVRTFPGGTGYPAGTAGAFDSDVENALEVPGTFSLHNKKVNPLALVR